MTIVAYLDDFLIIAKSKKEARRKTKKFVNLLLHLGIVINWEKSVLSPSRKIEFLGHTVDSASIEVRVPRKKRLRLVNELKLFLNARKDIKKPMARPMS